MKDVWEPDSRVLQDVTGPSGATYTIRLDGVAHGLAGEAQTFLERLPSSDPIVSYLRNELAVATDAPRLGITSAIVEESFAALVFCRSVVESAIRLSWLVADGSNEETVRTHLGRLEKRDLQQLLDASKAIDETSSMGQIVENSSELRAQLASISDAAAPNLRVMATEAGWEWLYGIHRFCSAVLHPGIGSRARVADIIGIETFKVLLHWSFSGAVCAAGAVALAFFADADAEHFKMNSIMFARRGFAEELPESGDVSGDETSGEMDPK